MLGPARFRRLATAGAVLAVAVALGCDRGGDPDSFCMIAQGVASDPALLEPEISTGHLDRLVEVYAEMEEAAPRAVRSDVAFLHEAVQKLREGDVSFAVDEEQAARLADAFDAVADYVREECPADLASSMGR